jgi:cold shock protein
MPSGTIARLLIDKGFGFIRDESGIEHFFHRSSVRGAVFELLREGQRVGSPLRNRGRARAPARFA